MLLEFLRKIVKLFYSKRLKLSAMSSALFLAEKLSMATWNTFANGRDLTTTIELGNFRKTYPIAKEHIAAYRGYVVQTAHSGTPLWNNVKDKIRLGVNASCLTSSTDLLAPMHFFDAREMWVLVFSVLFRTHECFKLDKWIRSHRCGPRSQD